MAKSFLVPIDLNKNEIQNPVLQNLGSAPGTPTEGQIYYDTTDDTVYVRGPSSWLDLTAVGGTVDYVSNVAEDVFLGRDSAGSGNSEEMSPTTAKALLAIASTDISDWTTAVKDTAGAMVTGNTETGITVTYQVADDTLDFEVQAGADGTAIHDNVNSEISAITAKTTAVDGDFILIEDSAASNAKKRISQTGLRITEGQISDFGTYLTDITGEDLADLNDVVITSVGDNDILAYDSGGNWINQTPGEAGLATSSHTHDVLSNIATATILGRNTGGSGDSEELSPTTARSILNVEDNADVTDETNVVASLNGATLTAITPQGGDKVLYQDITDASNIKTATAQQIANLYSTAASTTVSGIIEIAIDTEVEAGSSSSLAVSPNSLGTMNDLSNMAWVVDEDTMSSDSAILVPTQQSVKAYVDATASGLDVKESVDAATDSALTLASDFENGDTVDGIVLVTGDRVLIKDQGTGSENGIYTVNASGPPTRATDADADAEVTSGLFVFVEDGTANADSGWVLTTEDPITVGSTALAFSQFSGAGQITAGTGLTKTGNTINAIGGNGITANADELITDNNYIADTILAAAVTGNTETGITVTYETSDNTFDFVVTAATDAVAGIIERATIAETAAGTLTDRAVTPFSLDGMTTLANMTWFLDQDTLSGNDATKVASQQSIKAYVDNKTYAADVGNGALTTIPITHSLGTRDVTVQVYDSTGYDEIECDIVRNTTNQVTLDFSVAPTSAEFRVVVQA